MRRKGEKVRLRPITPGDMGQVSVWACDSEVVYWMGGTYRDRVGTGESGTLAVRGLNCYAIDTLDGIFIGDVRLQRTPGPKREAELTIRIGEREFWGRGYGTDAVSALVEYAFSGLRLDRIFLRVFAYNRRAIGCYEKCGFRREGAVKVSTPEGGEERLYLMSLERRRERRALPRRRASLRA